MYQTLTVTLEGVSPLLMHNGQTADPLNRFSKAMRAVSARRRKTDADHEEMARIEFMAGLYVDEEGPALPAIALEACILAGARRSRLGKQALAGVFVEHDTSLIYDGPRNADALCADERFHHRVPVRVGTARIIRTRPIFHSWSARPSICYLPQVIDRRNLLAALQEAGALIGIGDWRPRYGRFVVRE